MAAVTLERTPPLVVHLIYRLDIGGLETLLVDTINRMPAGRYRHAIVCLTDYTDFAARIERADVALFALHKGPGLAPEVHLKLFKLLRRLRPAILHTYNLGTIEYQAVALLAGVPVRIHAEHGRDASDPQGLNRKHNLLRRLLAHVIDRYVPVSADLARWLDTTVRLPRRKVDTIINGVDTDRFHAGAPLDPAAASWRANGAFVIGAVGRLQDVKNHAGLIDAFVRLRARVPDQQLRLVLVGDGPLRAQLEAQAAASGAGADIVFAGAHANVAALLGGFSLFALPSIAEGTPVTLLEAMASELPVVASAVGGIPEVVTHGVNGTLVPAGDPEALAQALAAYVRDPQRAAAHGRSARARIEQHYSMAAMLAAYLGLYDRLCKSKTTLRQAITPCAE
ncbi:MULTISPECIES: TIGR03088 family PEP-CTERM/XrtA system glycosyltransferase [unclassified Massilia]|uniref:TIGR03088 family PEP-CTERM/XrtA system glycosyltransferase n=1 Tax=unclassified Massilia TaxID=2609279 RepID=UPI00177E9A46|nr:MULTISPECIES: TIGR03088 family PEP-CTERM/XrtA system glycosyltransferase [unclassified Massilia]MBD8531327.1 TIGR03088 family PEP-CTERM/XrtA system glycosyltransferase [Massilia sp. CFBP 13647]MBD8674418.1 TIGR03088 family PEP-CTERM/XrtA system glycosyltransferase [Massilia sp. CFBP 13721]